MTGLFRSKSCGVVRFTFNPPTPDFHSEEDEKEEEEDDEDAEEEVEEFSDGSTNPITTPYFSPSSEEQGGHGSNSNNHFTILDMVVAALRKSLVTCSVESEDVSAMDISWPTEVRHVSHVTFDRFNGFLGLPSEFEPELPRKVPSASANVFGVSAKSMQCSYDDRGNSVPSILLMMQKRLYVEGGLKAEGIFRINAENSHEVYVRHELNKGVVPRGIDVHCLAGLIKAWFRELPSGVLDSLTPEQVLHCNTEDDCTQLVKLLPPTEAALLDWAVNLMADVVEHEQYNKMNARNVAMVFAPNMTQMADPLTALIHAVQVMNLLKTLILKTLREREESASKSRLRSSCLRDSPTRKTEPCQSNLSEPHVKSQESRTPEVATTGKYLSSATVNVLESDNLLEEDRKLQKISDGEEELGSIPGSSPPSFEKTASESKCKVGGYDDDDGEWLSLRKGVRRLCRHPVFQMSKPAKKTQGLGIVNARGGREAWA